MKNYLVTAVISLAVVVVAFLLIKPVQNVTNTSLGSVVGPDSSFPCESHNGVTSCFGAMDFRTATNTVCSIKSPSATSTLVAATAQIRNGYAFATSWDVGRATTAYATTTRLGRIVVGSGAQANIVATTTATTLLSGVVNPNSFINVKVASTSVAGTRFGGSCTAVFRVL